MASVEDITAVVTDRCGAFLAEARLITGDEGAPSVNQAIAWGLRALGFPTATIRQATNDEVLAAPDARLDALIDLSELRLLESVQTNLTSVTVKAGPVQEDYNHLAERLAAIIKEKRANAAARYGRWLAVPLGGDGPKRANVRVV